MRQYILTALLAWAATSAAAQQGELKGQYWFDSSTERHTFTPGRFEVDAGPLREGLHMLHATVASDSAISTAASAWFVRLPQVDPAAGLSTAIFIDGKMWQTIETTAGAGSAVPLQLDMNALDLGVHSIGVQAITVSGAVTEFREAFFMRVPTTAEISTLHGYYLLDGKPAGEIRPTVNGQAFHLDIDASSLTAGIHSVLVHLAAPLGISTSTETAWFVKIPQGGEGVNSYRYWLNDDESTTQTVQLEAPMKSLALVKLIDLPEVPFCSQRYTFAVEEGNAVVYARNSFQMHFFDPDGRVTIGNGDFTDTRVRRSIDKWGSLTSGERNRMAALAENEIGWYRFAAEAGDSVAVRTDRGAMLELYSPTGTLLAAKRGADATRNATATLTENGDYYLAVHDVQGNSGADIYFEHIPRHAVLEWSPRRIGNAGMVYMDILGNGFSELKELHLEGDGGVIEPEETAVKDNYNLTASFRLGKAVVQNGSYTLVCEYADETMRVKDAVTIEDAQPSDIEVRILTPFKPATPYEVTVEVTNHSNASFWGIPFNLALRDQPDGIAISFKDFRPTDYSNPSGDIPEAYYTDNLLGSGESGHVIAMLIPGIGPNETKRLTFGVRSKPMERLRMYTWAGKPWSEEFEEILAEGYDFSDIIHPEFTNVFSARTAVYLYSLLREEESVNTRTEKPARAPETGNVQPQYPNRNWRDLGHANDLAHNAASVAENAGRALGGLENGMRLHGSEAVLAACGYDWRNGDENPLSDYQNSLKQNMPDPASLLADALGWGDYYALAQSLFGNNCANNPNNPQNSIAPHDFTGYQSGDPNEMHGYESPSGGRHIGLGVKEVQYTIEFENDPEIANAPAQVINVTDVLDGERFDLASMKPLSMKIGDKTMELPQSHHFTATLDMRTEINALAELHFDYDDTTGKAEWTIRSLDPMTMDPISYAGNGVLPVNDDTGRGTGLLTYAVRLKDGLADGTEVSNKATIIFDDNEAIDTPVWTNVTDYTRPESRIAEKTADADGTLHFAVEGSDTGAGIWYYDLYMRRQGSKAWQPVKTMIADDNFDFTTDAEGADFAVIATDGAGNRQDDALLTALAGDADGNGTVDAVDAVAVRNYYTDESTPIVKANADVTADGTIDAQDATQIRNLYLENPNQTRQRLKRK